MNAGIDHDLDVPAQGSGERGRARDGVVRLDADDHATLTPQTALQYGATYTVTVKGGAGGVTDCAGNALAADSSWSFTTEASPPPILVVGSTANPFARTWARSSADEGLNAFTTIDVAFLSPALLAQFDVVVLGDTALNAAQVSALSGLGERRAGT